MCHVMASLSSGPLSVSETYDFCDIDFEKDPLQPDWQNLEKERILPTLQPPERERAVARSRVRTRERRLLVGRHDWHVGARPCTKGEGCLAGAVGLQRIWTDSNQHGAARARRKRATARSLSGGGAPRALAACPRRAALVGVSSCPMKAHCTSDTALSVGARPCSNVPAAASNEQPAFACAHTTTRRRTISLGRRRTTPVCGVRAPCRAGWSWPMLHGSLHIQRDGFLPWCMAALRRASCAL